MTGVMLDCPAAKALSHFYAALLGKPVTYEADGVAMIGEDGSQPVLFQQVEHYTAPRWPDPAYPQQIHLDVTVQDVDAAERAALDMAPPDWTAPARTGASTLTRPAALLPGVDGLRCWSSFARTLGSRVRPLTFPQGLRSLVLLSGTRHQPGGGVRLPVAGAHRRTPRCRRAARPLGRCMPPSTRWPPMRSPAPRP